MNKTTWTRIGIIATVVIAVAAVITLLVNRSDDSNGPNQTTGNACEATGTGNSVNCNYVNEAKSAQEKTEEEILADSRRDSTIPTQGNGPWPFVVAKDRGIGLKVRTTDTAEGVQIGGLASHHTAWVMCKHNSGFDPEPGAQNGPIWYKIKWDNQSPSSGFFESDFSAKSTAWAYGGYLVPIGHNGSVPDC